MSPTAIRYPIAAAVRARELHAVGWSSVKARELLEREFGTRPTHDTFLRWVDPEFAARRAEKDRERHKRRLARTWTFTTRGKLPTPEYQAAFVRRLRAEGEPVAGIVRVCRVVFGGRWTRGRVLRLLEGES